MNESLSHNKISFYEKQENQVSFSFWISSILAILFLLSCTIEIRISTPFPAIYEEETNHLIILCPLTETNLLSKQEILKIEKIQYPFQIENRGELLIDETTKQNIQKIIVTSPKKFQNNQILQIHLLDKKEKIIMKIKKIIQGG